MSNAPVVTSITEYRQRIVDFANADSEHGWFEHVYEGKLYKYPKRALLWAVFGNSSAIAKMLPPYQAVCPRGFKMQGDDCFHSDVWIGCGGDPDKAYCCDIAENDLEAKAMLSAFAEAKYAIEHEMLAQYSFDFVVLANGLPDNVHYVNVFVCDAEKKPKPNEYSSTSIYCRKLAKVGAWGEKLNAICIPKATVEFSDAAQNANVIITEVGGKLVHLATVSRERGKLLIRVDDAKQKFPVFSKLRIDLKTLKITPILY